MIYQRIGLLLLVFAQVGCMSPLTRRIDMTNQQMAEMRGELITANSNLTETKVFLATDGTAPGGGGQTTGRDQQTPRSRWSASPNPSASYANAGEITEAMCWEGKLTSD